jgi:hypothetical protein
VVPPKKMSMKLDEIVIEKMVIRMENHFVIGFKDTVSTISPFFQITSILTGFSQNLLVVVSINQKIDQFCGITAISGHLNIP